LEAVKKSCKSCKNLPWLSPQGKLRLVYTHAQHERELLEPDIDIEEFPNQAFASGNTGPQRRVARMGHNLETDAIFFNFFTNKIFLKRKSFYLENICEMKVFLKRK